MSVVLKKLYLHILWEICLSKLKLFKKRLVLLLKKRLAKNIICLSYVSQYHTTDFIEVDIVCNSKIIGILINARIGCISEQTA